MRNPIKPKKTTHTVMSIFEKARNDLLEIEERETTAQQTLEAQLRASQEEKERARRFSTSLSNLLDGTY